MRCGRVAAKVGDGPQPWAICYTLAPEQRGEVGSLPLLLLDIKGKVSSRKGLDSKCDLTTKAWPHNASFE